jgi:GNAT superfamily N-acetyltransferase
MNSEQICAMEELSLNAWPAPKVLFYDGWVVRFAGGYTGRANSVTPLRAGTINLEEKIRFCCEMYRRHGLPAKFKLTAASQPPGLEAALAGQGFRADGGAIVQVAELAELSREFDRRVREHSIEEWADALVALGEDQPRNLPMLRAIVGAFAVPTSLVLMHDQGRIAAAGMAVLQDRWIGLFHIVTHHEMRRQGCGYSVVQTLLNWGKSNGAERAYLQVVPGNVPARGLYDGFGFRDAYEYQYWRRD